MRRHERHEQAADALVAFLKLGQRPGLGGRFDAGDIR